VLATSLAQEVRTNYLKHRDNLRKFLTKWRKRAGEAGVAPWIVIILRSLVVVDHYRTCPKSHGSRGATRVAQVNGATAMVGPRQCHSYLPALALQRGFC
jgi:hypothetical protein